MRQIVNSKSASKAIGPYSHAVVAGELVFISGQLPINPQSNEIPDEVAEQTKQSIENLQSILSDIHLKLDDVVKTTVYIKDMNDFEQMNEVYGQYFKSHYPARVCVEVSRLPKDSLVEIDAIAIK
ncbi:reactive intermediate/imine deaminase [Bacillus sp. M6-12]|uniref:RidA family protein n=1 Tax=Bacillus sp. M6-12 TaxID=2054166 RepID=UPI000C784547|nr:RidA family protein [Bacillus sp. M6-12]PLS16043.1 reactive intermediate/imine deaminase [Bacillus sp. M6-12]